MTEKKNHDHENWVSEKIAEELTPQGDLLPPWQKYPDLPRYSTGWRMGGGESYMTVWNKWAGHMTLEESIEYFRRYLPIPPSWLDWVAMECGQEDVIDDMLSGNGDFIGIHWLEQHGLANFSEFKSWYDDNWDKTTGKR